MTLVLIHGGSHGAWCWQQVQECLAQANEASYAFDMPGCGADTTPRADIRLRDHIERGIDRINELPDGPIQIVGHSIAGWVLPPLAAAFTNGRIVGKQLTDLVFVAAATLDRAESGIGVTPVERRQSYFDLAAASPDNSLMLDFDAAWGRFFQHLSHEQAVAAYRQLTPQPFGPYTDPSPVGVSEVDVERTYIAMDDDLTYPVATTGEFAAKAGVQPLVIAGDHDVMLSDPAGLAEALLTCGG